MSAPRGKEILRRKRKDRAVSPSECFTVMDHENAGIRFRGGPGTHGVPADGVGGEVRRPAAGSWTDATIPVTDGSTGRAAALRCRNTNSPNFAAANAFPSFSCQISGQDQVYDHCDEINSFF